MARLFIAVSREIGEALKLAAGQGHQFRNGGEIPIGVEDLGMAHVGGQGEHHLIDVGAISMPEHQAPDDKSVAQVVKAWRSVRAAIDPTEAVTQRIEDTVCLPVAERLPKSPATATDEERSVGLSLIHI